MNRIAIHYAFSITDLFAAIDRAKMNTPPESTLRGAVSPALRAQIFGTFVGMESASGGIKLGAADFSSFAEKFEFAGLPFVVDHTLAPGAAFRIDRMDATPLEEVRSSCIPAAYIETA